jgi:hypothetical protein
MPRTKARRFSPGLAMALAAVLACLIFLSLAPAWAELQVKGNARFGAQITNALSLLQSKAPDAYRIVTNEIGVIQQGEHSGMWAYRVPPVFEIADPTTFYSVTWCAGCIAHDSIHSKLYHDWQRTNSNPVPDEIWTGAAAEKQCLEHQVKVLVQIGAPTNEIIYCRQVKPDFFDVNKHGTNTWEDFKRRNW